jgi:hypothetical protein
MHHSVASNSCVNGARVMQTGSVDKSEENTGSAVLIAMPDVLQQ